MFIDEVSLRSFRFESDGKAIETPLFVPAISSTKANWKILQYVELIDNIGYPAFLLSAYDYHGLNKSQKEKLQNVISKYLSKQAFLFLDNGNYEASWFKDKTWSFGRLKTVLESINPDFCFSFDVFWSKNSNCENSSKKTATAIAKTASMQKTGSTIALFHSTPSVFPRIIRQVLDDINPEIIAVPERELGFGLFERAGTIKNIRFEINKTHKKVPIHILGTGNPLSILVYTLCGADSYDALDWSSTFIDPKNGRQYPFCQKDLVDCTCAACRIKKIPYDYQVMAHNLIFYQAFLNKIRKSMQNGKISSLFNEYLPEKAVSSVKKISGLK
jgi:queuine/archaeosine tRNA-ribosyltransferase